MLLFTPYFLRGFFVPKNQSSSTVFFVPCSNRLKSKKTLMRVSKVAKSRAFWRLSSKVANYTAKVSRARLIIYKPINTKIR